MITQKIEPDYLPARMLNEFVYCPRLFYYEWVDGVFAHNRETVEGANRHAKLDAKEQPLPTAEELQASGESIHARSITLTSEQYRLIAKLDIVEADGESATPVDYKRGRPKENRETGLPEAWDADRAQIAAQALVLMENGYRCHEGIIYYVSTKQRVTIPVNDELIAFATRALEDAWQLARVGRIPPPLADSPKCPRCSLVGICLPDETRACAAQSPAPAMQRTLFEVDWPAEITSRPMAKEDDAEVRRLQSARDDLKPLYLNTQGLYVGKSGAVLKIKEKDKVVQEVRINDICQLNMMGNIQISTQTVQELCQAEVPIAYFSQGGWFYGVTHGLGVKNIYLRREQFRLADVPAFCLRMAKAIVAGKIRNQRVLLQRNHIAPPASALAQMRCMIDDVEGAEGMEQLLGIEGNAARVYFQNFAGMIKVGDDAAEEHRAETGKSSQMFAFDFARRNRRPPRDPINALLSLAYSLLAKDLTIVCHCVGFDPFLGFYHQPRYGRAPLALDLMEPFRPLIAESAVLSAINTRMIGPGDFIQVAGAVALKPEGRKAFFRAYEQRMDTLVTHPLFGYRVSYRRLLEIQTRLFARVMTGELSTYPVFTTR